MPKVKEEKSLKEKIELSQKIIKEIKSKLRKNAPELTPLYLILQEVPVKEEIIFETDGEKLYYNPDVLISYFRERRCKELEWQYLHLVLHGMLGHFGMERWESDPALMDAVLDIKVESILYNMGKNIHGILDIGMMKCCCGYGIYQLYDEATKNCWLKNELLQMEARLEDHHEVWASDKWSCYIPVDELEEEKEDTKEEEKTILLNEQKGTKDRKKSKQLSINIWKKNAMLVTNGQLLEDYVQQQYMAGSFMNECCKEVKTAKDNRMSYSELLTNLVISKQTFLEDEGSIDRILYSYGFDLYEDVALIEPQDSKEEEHFHTLVIAIDTSGSCFGEIISKFLRETKNIFRDILQKGSFEKIILFQCDDKIRQEKYIYDVKEIPDFKKMKVYGAGGTSFVPVFRRIEEIRKKEQCKIDGLLFLSDGLGEYPKKEPDYPVYFVFSSDIFFDCKLIPNWVKKVTFD